MGRLPDRSRRVVCPHQPVLPFRRNPLGRAPRCPQRHRSPLLRRLSWTVHPSVVASSTEPSRCSSSHLPRPLLPLQARRPNPRLPGCPPCLRPRRPSLVLGRQSHLSMGLYQDLHHPLPLHPLIPSQAEVIRSPPQCSLRRATRWQTVARTRSPPPATDWTRLAWPSLPICPPLCACSPRARGWTQGRLPASSQTCSRTDMLYSATRSYVAVCCIMHTHTGQDDCPMISLPLPYMTMALHDQSLRLYDK